MTVRYSERISQFLFRWRGSVWRLVWRDLLAFCVLYAIINIAYHKLDLSETQRKNYAYIVDHFYDVAKALHTILSLMLGFYVSSMVARWWSQFEALPWPEDLLNYISFVIHKNDEESRLTRRAAARYFCLTTALAGRHFSEPLYERFPTEEHIVKAGLMTQTELELYRKTNNPDSRWFLPMQWMQKLIVQTTVNQNLAAPHTIRIQQEINDCIIRFRKLFCYDWVSLPLVYSQVVVVAVFFYFACCLIGYQTYALTGEKRVDYFVPVEAIFQLLFFLGWLRVGQNLMKPFGSDDEDIEISNLFDRHVEMAYTLIEQAEQPTPDYSDIIPDVVASGSLQNYNSSYVSLCSTDLKRMEKECVHTNNCLQRIFHARHGPRTKFTV